MFPTASAPRGLRAAALLALPLLSVNLHGVPPAAYLEPDFLTRVRRLTVEGRRAGEGYWSPDGRQFVFQSEREPGNLFYQIYTMDLTSGETTRISTGTGKTTCAFFRPGTDQIEFASTHADPASKAHQDEELAIRASGKEHRYSWDYEPAMDIYSYDVKTRVMTPLTTAPGYDGGPFFTSDGKRIVWRRFDEQGLIADAAGPDGKTLAWTSSRAGGSAGQIFFGQWNHDKALVALRSAPPRKPAKS